jgi:hypothetical protein
MRVLAFVLWGASLVGACHSSSAVPVTSSTPATASAARPTSPPSGATRVTDVLIPVAIHPVRGDSAIRAFVPDIAASDSGGECSLMRTTGSGATNVLAYFPARASARMQVTITFDSSGRLVRYSERRGIPHIGPTVGMTMAQVASALRAGEAAVRSTSISLDYPVDQAIVSNRGGCAACELGH